MGKGKALTDEQKGIALALFKELTSERDIAYHIGKSKTSVHNFLWTHQHGGHKRKAGRHRTISRTQVRGLLRHASSGNYSARQLRDLLNLPVTVRRIQQLLLNCENLVYKKMKSVPMMTDKHKEDRYKWATDHITWTVSDWKTVVFSDEKRFCLDGPDGFAHYWHDLRKEPRVFSKRQQGGKSIMLWAACAYGGLSNLCLIDDNMDSVMYCDILSTEMLRFGEEVCGDPFYFQQDGASVHRSNHTMTWLDANDIYLIPWPAKSPDLNPIENLWGILARQVYKNQRQFEGVEDLKATVMDEWNSITAAIRKNLIRSMPKRCLEVIERSGCKTHY